MKIIISIFLATMSLSAFAKGGDQGNGGSTVVCRSSAGEIVSIEVLDLYEGRMLQDFKYTESTAPALSQARMYADKIAHAMGNHDSGESFSGEVDDVYNSFSFLPSGTGLMPIEDSFEFIAPKNCEIVQTANRMGHGKIYIDQDIWNKMSETQKAALILHEAVYRSLQRSKVSGVPVEKDSRRTRSLVAHLFAGKELESQFAMPDKASKIHLICETNIEDSDDSSTTTFSVYQTMRGDLIAQFGSWLSHKVMARTWVNSYMASNQSWPGPIVISGPLNSPMENNRKVKAVIRFDTDLAGEVWFLFREGPSKREPFRCGLVK